ncbi:unnamed protein product [Effrenium voratum]|nr:unnamed protein product [Effrenium voratum]
MEVVLHCWRGRVRGEEVPLKPTLVFAEACLSLAEQKVVVVESPLPETHFFGELPGAFIGNRPAPARVLWNMLRAQRLSCEGADVAREAAWAMRAEAALGPVVSLVLWGFGPCFRRIPGHTGATQNQFRRRIRHGPMRLALGLLVGSTGFAAFAAFAAFGRKPRVSLRKAEDPTPTPFHGRTAPEVAAEKQQVAAEKPHRQLRKHDLDPLEEDLERLARAVLPSEQDKRAKTKVLKRLQDVAEEVLGPRAEVWPFGSSANGCGERFSDLDLVITHELSKPITRRQSRPLALGALAELAELCIDEGFEVEELREARVPILIMQKDGYDIDLSYGNLLPILNTRLLRSYATLNPKLAKLTAAVKRWAKRKGIAKTWEGFISSYAWTLMVIYYLQTVGELPSLHLLEDEVHRFPPDLGFACSFASAAEAEEAWQAARDASCAELLRGFFQFYTEDFDWTSEVVSVRLGFRSFINSRSALHDLRRGIGLLHIEDPIDVGRNLNFALTESAVDTLRYELDTAQMALAEGKGLEVLLAEVPQEDGGWRGQDGFLDLPEDPAQLRQRCPTCLRPLSLGELPEHSERCALIKGRGNCCCGLCARCFPTLLELEEHQDNSGHGDRMVDRESLLRDMPLPRGGQRRRKFLRRR